MNRKIALVAAVAFLSGGVGAAMAQYPSITGEVKAEADRRTREVQEHSDAAWAAAQPAIEEGAKNGRPYHPSVNGPGDFVKGDVPAFPGAEGLAGTTVGGRGGKVFVVTSLEDSGPGTYREALEVGGPRIVVFNVAGIVHLKTKIRVRAPYLTIDGATAPGDGVCIAGDTTELETHDVIIRHMRFRRGNMWVGDRNDSLGGNPIGNILLDHVSASWGLDENFSMYRYMFHPAGGGPEQKRATMNVTIQWSISSEGLNTYNHSFASTIGGANNAFHHNLYACNTGRNPSLSMGGSYNWINNVVFNWKHRTMDGAGATTTLNSINNFYKPGPATPREEPIGYRLFKIDGGPRPGSVPGLFVNGNIVDGNDAVTKDNWAGGIQVDHEDAKTHPEIADLEAHLTDYRAEKPKQAPSVRVIHTAQQAYELVLANSGATLPKRDPVDIRVAEMVRTGKPTAVTPPDIAETLRKLGCPQVHIEKTVAEIPHGIITDPAQVGGYPDYKGEPYVDTDKDGMPDAWEIKYGLNPKDASDSAGDINGDGYTNIEKFMYGLDPTKKVDWKDPNNNVDPAMHLPPSQPMS